MREEGDRTRTRTRVVAWLAAAGSSACRVWTPIPPPSPWDGKGGGAKGGVARVMCARRLAPLWWATGSHVADCQPPSSPAPPSLARPVGSLQKEWLVDSKGFPAMSGQLFFHAVFELIGAVCP